MGAEPLEHGASAGDSQTVPDPGPDATLCSVAAGLLAETALAGLGADCFLTSHLCIFIGKYLKCL